MTVYHKYEQTYCADKFQFLFSLNLCIAKSFKYINESVYLEALLLDETWPQSVPKEENKEQKIFKLPIHI